MKLDKNFIIPMSITLSVFVIGIVVNETPAFPSILATIVVILPLLITQQRTKNDWGKMFCVGMLLAIVYIALLTGVYILANYYEWLKRIVTWPA